jgi:uncharacterized membrane protein YqjE
MSDSLISVLSKLLDHFLEAIALRGELASIELEREKQRLLTQFVWGMLAFLFGGLACLFISAAAVVIFWDSYRVEAVLTVSAFHAFAFIIAVVKIKYTSKNRAKPLQETFRVLKDDFTCVFRQKLDT